MIQIQRQILIPKSVVDLIFTDGHGTPKLEMSVAKANATYEHSFTQPNREYKINRKKPSEAAHENETWIESEVTVYGPATPN